jgi:choline dehydrogenase
MQATLARGSFSRAARSASSRKRSASSAGAWQMRPQSRGYIEAKSNRPGDNARDQPTLSLGGTRPARHHRGLHFARRMFAAPALQRFVREKTLPSSQIQTDDELLDYARRYGGTCYHASCTCLMGFAPDVRRRQRIARARHRWA